MIKKIITVLIFFLVWFILTYFNIIKPIFLPPLPEFIISLKELLTSTEGLKDIFFTLRRIIIAFLLGIIISIPIGMLFGSFKKVYELFEWFIDFFRSVPNAALFPLFLIFFGFGDRSKVAIGAWSSGFIILVNTIHGVWNVKKNRKMMAITKKATSMQILRKITFFEVLPYIFAGMRIGISWNLIVIIVAEMFIGTKHGLGHRIYDASTALDTAGVIAGIFVIGIIGLLINYLLSNIENKVIHWKGV